MSPSFWQRHLFKTQAILATVFLFALSAETLGSVMPRVVARNSISHQQRALLENKLKAITGWRDLRFTSEGALVLGSSQPTTGSKTARELLKRTLAGERVILFEDASGRKDIAFCRVGVNSLVGENTSTVYVVLIDFADFKQLTGDRQARAAFDVGWAVLHEIDHVVKDSTDPKTPGAVGDCEAHINQMRQELGLPVRSDYYFSFLPLKTDLRLVSRFVRLGFHWQDEASGKTKRYWLLWDAALVGGLPSEAQAALF